jgi:hypothetical protein
MGIARKYDVYFYSEIVKRNILHAWLATTMHMDEYAVMRWYSACISIAR